MSRRNRCFRTQGERELVNAAIARGWERLERTGTNHIQLRWPASGCVVNVPSKVNDGRARTILRQLERTEKGQTNAIA